MPRELITSFDMTRLPDPNDQATFHANALYSAQHMGAHVIPKFNTNLEWLEAALGGDTSTMLDALAALQIAARDASELNAGIVPAGRLSGSYSIDISGTAKHATNAAQLGGKAASGYASFVDWNAAGDLKITGALHVRQNVSGHYATIFLADDESVNGNKGIHANSDLIGFLGGDSNWINYTNAAGHVWTLGYGWLHERFAQKGVNCQHNSGIVEFGGVDPFVQDLTVDCPNPYVMVGLRSISSGGWVYVRGVVLRNN